MNRVPHRIEEKIVSGRPKGLQLRSAVIEVLHSAPADAVLDLVRIPLIVNTQTGAS